MTMLFLIIKFSRTWTNNYKEFLETLVAGSEKAPAQIQDYKDYNTDRTVKFIVQVFTLIDRI